MKKRVVLWSSFVAGMALIVFIVIKLAGDESSSGQSDAVARKATRSNAPEVLDIKEEDWIKGNPDAEVVIVKYSDFQCPACRYVASMDDRLSDEMGDEVAFVFRHFPLRNFEYSRVAARYVEAAGKQGHFWRMHDLVYINQQRWARGNTEDIFQQFAESLNLDMEQLERDLEDPAIEEKIEAHYNEGRRLNIRSVPSVFINGDKIQTPGSVEAYRELIESYF